MDMSFSQKNLRRMLRLQNQRKAQMVGKETWWMNGKKEAGQRLVTVYKVGGGHRHHEQWPRPLRPRA